MQRLDEWPLVFALHWEEEWNLSGLNREIHLFNCAEEERKKISISSQLIYGSDNVFVFLQLSLFVAQCAG